MAVLAVAEPSEASVVAITEIALTDKYILETDKLLVR